jgi:hypothetical protein
VQRGLMAIKSHRLVRHRWNEFAPVTFLCVFDEDEWQARLNELLSGV